MIKVKRILLFLCYLLVINSAYTKTVGKLVYLGNTVGSIRSVWLSATSPGGSFQLETQGQIVVDSWAESQKSLHLSLSPYVSQGNGGTHFLIDATTGRHLDSQNQQGGITPTPPDPNPNPAPPGPAPGPRPPPTPSKGGQSVPPNGIAPTQIIIPELPILPGPSNGTDNAFKFQTMEGRQFSTQSQWHIWNNNRYTNINDGRYQLDSTGNAGLFSLGGDKRITRNLVGGLMISYNNYQISAFNDELKNKAGGFVAGPYLGYQINNHWTTQGFINAGTLEYNNLLSILSSHYTSRIVTASIQAIGFYQIKTVSVRIKPSVNYAYFSNPQYKFHGTFRGSSFALVRPKAHYDTGFARINVEGFKSITLKNDVLLQPHAELGYQYQYEQPNEGQVITGLFTLANASPSYGSVTAGLRAFISKSLLVEVKGGYQSLGQNGLNLWTGGLYASYLFS